MAKTDMETCIRKEKKKKKDYKRGKWRSDDRQQNSTSPRSRIDTLGKKRTWLRKKEKDIIEDLGMNWQEKSERYRVVGKMVHNTEKRMKLSGFYLAHGSQGAAHGCPEARAPSFTPLQWQPERLPGTGRGLERTPRISSLSWEGHRPTHYGEKLGPESTGIKYMNPCPATYIH